MTTLRNKVIKQRPEFVPHQFCSNVRRNFAIDGGVGVKNPEIPSILHPLPTCKMAAKKRRKKLRRSKRHQAQNQTTPQKHAPNSTERSKAQAHTHTHTQTCSQPLRPASKANILEVIPRAHRHGVARIIWFCCCRCCRCCCCLYFCRFTGTL